MLALPLQLPAIAAAGTGAVINDVTQLNPIPVAQVLTPTRLDEIVAAVKTHHGPISIGGGRYSMGGQTATEQALQIDMRQFDQVLAFSAERKEVTVQTGITWRKLQRFIDPHNLSLQIMQTYSNFTVGGSLSVNVHGRYIGQGPLVYSVKAIRIVLPDGRLVRASRDENSTIFYGAIGGYGALGVIVEATLALTDNVAVERKSEVMPLSAYRAYFFGKIASDPDVVFHNADIYPDAFDTVRATSYVKTSKAPTVPQRLIPPDQRYWLDRGAFWIMSELPFGKAFRQHVIDPLVFRGERVEWRNYEASYDVKELEPSSRQDSTYVLQEYFVPVEHLEQFVPRMGEILRRHHVNTINVSIRHAKQDPGTLLAWARKEVFAYVLYYKQGTGAQDKAAVRAWTREMIDAATAMGGAYYLPYQIHATPAQFHAAYPNAGAFFQLKKALDPDNKFRNKLWDAYYLPAAPATPAARVAVTASPAAPPLPVQRTAPQALPAPTVARALASVPGYRRDEAQTYLTLPEWVLVYHPDEYARFIKDHPPSAYPYFGAIGQFWGYYWDAYAATRASYDFNWGYHLMVCVIGTSYTVENAIKGAYEDTLGRASEATRGANVTPEEVFAARVAQDYVDFIRVDPWYEFSFATPLKRLWVETPLTGPDMVRKWERKLILSLEYTIKASYASAIKLASKAVYGDADTEMLALTSHVAPDALRPGSKMQVISQFADGSTLLSLPRYEAFRDDVIELGKQGVAFREIAGNGTILVTSLVPADWRYDLAEGKVLFEKPILTAPRQKRIAINAPVRHLTDIVRQLAARHYTVEHIYDY
ncbi:FAD-binding oxidoreductase [Duganella sp. LX47W]|uniref:FAD-binding oxidoreductase n=2 Tax=Rugamonas apoptosis TaxID=2758570 RepID=A0A7W2FB44_9BURK|nr:FAD-binding oxidoreductase [Rugamonas apoptosis]